MGQSEAPTRRSFLRAAAGAVASGTVASAVAGEVAGCSGSPGAHQPPGSTRMRLRSTRAENSLPGEPHWWIKHVGAPDAIQGFTGRASVPQGDPVTLYVSTTSREFRVAVLRMG